MLSVTESGSDLTLLTWTGTGQGPQSAAREAEKAWTSLDGALEERGAVPIQERVFGTLQVAADVARGRAAAVVSHRERWTVPPTYVEGGPVDHDGLAGIHVVAARTERTELVRDGKRILGRIADCDSARLLGLADIGRLANGRLASGPAEETGATLEAAVSLLEGQGYTFRDVARTWFYLKDILDWYGPFNAVRNDAFRRLGLMGKNGDGAIPASTGIEGRNARGGWCTLDLIAAKARPGHRFEMERLHNQKQNEATEYGSAFARGMALTLGDCRYYFVSGTASIDDRGATVHVGDFDTQAEYTLTAVASLLESAGAALPDVRQATAFLKNPCDQRSFQRIADRAGLSGVPMVTTVADVCRDDLLFEIDATAVVPLRRDEAGR
jgi:enamine deaminase RidA (YjgF/YER057c/UK114 family)